MKPLLPHTWMNKQRSQGYAVCLVLDSADERSTRQGLLRSTPPDQYQSVYNQTSVAELADIGPFLFMLDNPDDRHLLKLFKAPQRNWGWLASLPPGSLGALAEHWRARALVGERPQQALYRFHDNRVLSRAIEQLPNDARPTYLGPAISVCYWQGEHWASADNPAPGRYLLPNDPPWLHTSLPKQEAAAILRTNVRRYLLAEHLEAYARLAEKHPHEAWLDQLLAHADAWSWTTPAALALLLTHALKTPAVGLPTYWQPRPDESPTAHLERVVATTTFWEQEGPL